MPEMPKFVALTLIRSLHDDGRAETQRQVQSVFELAGAKIEFSGAYLGWKPDTDSAIMQVVRDTYQGLFNKVPEIMVMHAGLECGLFKTAYPSWDMVSFGPTIRFPHSPNEKVEIKTVGQYRELLVKVLEIYSSSELRISMTCIIKPVFISGASRSGTTMLGSQLASHSEAFALPEMPFIWEMIRSNAKTEAEIRVLYNEISDDFHYRATGIKIGFDAFAQPFLDEKPAAERVFQLLRHHVALNDKKVIYWIEHTPHNRERIETYQAIFPDAKFIHVVRDPRAVYASMHKLPRWNSKDPVGFALRWNTAQTHGFLGVNKAGNYGIWVRYEDIVLSPSDTLHKLSEFIGYDFQEELLTGNGMILPEYTKEQHQLVGKAVDPSRINAWKNTIPTRDAELIMWKSLAWMKHFDYCSIAEANRVKPLSTLEKVQYKIKQTIATQLKNLRRFLDSRALQ